jgi:hypothetical protein
MEVPCWEVRDHREERSFFHHHGQARRAQRSLRVRVVVWFMVGEASPSTWARPSPRTNRLRSHPLELRLRPGHGHQHLVEIPLHEESMDQKRLSKEIKKPLDPAAPGIHAAAQSMHR